MILYLDTSALVKLYAEERGREEVQSAVREARVVAISEIGYVEARSALARKERERFFSKGEHDDAVGSSSATSGKSTFRARLREKSSPALASSCASML